MIYLLPQTILESAKRTPDKEAFVCGRDRLTYAEAASQIRQLAAALTKLGVERGDRVGLYLNRSIETVIGMHGVMLAGAAYVPLDPKATADRLRFQIEDCGIRTIVTNAAQQKNWARTQVRGKGLKSVVGLPEAPDGLEGLSWSDVFAFPTDFAPAFSAVETDLAYIMYTSGSTGVPKGMMHTHLGSVAYARWGADHVSMSANDRVASHAPLHFDLSIFDFFSTVQSGATVVLVPEAVTRFAASWTRTIESQRISIVFTVPYTLITMQEQGAMDERDLSSLRWILFGGEPFPPDKLRRLMLQLKQVTFTNVYGPAEAPSCTCHNVTLPEEDSQEPISIGIVSRNSADIINDENDEDCPDGQAGELCIRSTTLTRGYWNRPDLNKVAFLTRNTVEAFPAVYFRTGDRVVRGADGNLSFLGRIGRMVKIRGQRVELDEVESVLANMKDAREVAAFTVSGAHDSLQIICAVTLVTGSKAVATDFLKLARSRLPPYAVPTEIQIMKELPHTSTGKLNRKQLAEAWKK